MTKIFLSYRREDSADVVGRIFDRLERHFGRESLFWDVDAIRYGEDFRRRVGEALDQTGVLLAIIGDRWLDAPDRGQPAGGRRLDDPNDYVGIEISSALKRGITVMPVLVGGAQMPRSADLPAHLAELSYRNAAEVRSGRDFSFHVNRLITAINDLLALPQELGSLQQRLSTRVAISTTPAARRLASCMGMSNRETSSCVPMARRSSWTL